MNAEIIVLGSVRGSDETIAELEAAALDHVHRSRQEPGCLAHGVSRSLDDPNLLVFVERWADRAALDRHFGEPGSALFVEAAMRLSIETPTLDIYTAGDQAAPELG